MAITSRNYVAMKHFYMWYTQERNNTEYCGNEFYMDIFSEAIKNNDSNALIWISKYMKHIDNPEFEIYYELAYININKNENSKKKLLLFSIELKKYDRILDILCSFERYLDEEIKELLNYLEKYKLYFSKQNEKYIQLMENVNPNFIRKFENNNQINWKLNFMRKTNDSNQIIWKLIKEQIDLMEINLNYSPDSIGFDEAKKNFFNFTMN